MFIGVSILDKKRNRNNHLTINASYILKYRPFLNKNGDDDGSVIHFSTGESITVIESVSQLKKMLTLNN